MNENIAKSSWKMVVLPKREFDRKKNRYFGWARIASFIRVCLSSTPVLVISSIVLITANGVVNAQNDVSEGADQLDTDSTKKAGNIANDTSAVATSKPTNSAQSSQDVIRLSATITGNQEQPKVLYIVPWKQTSDNTILDQGLESRLSDVFDHVERSEHRREVKYFEQLINNKVSSETSAGN